MSVLTVQQLVLRDRGMIDPAMTFAVADGEIGALFGRPQSGIREALRVIAGLDQPLRGEVRLGNTPVHELRPEKRRIGLVQRNSMLFPGTVADNVGFGLKHGDWPKADRGRRIAEALELVGMTGAEHDRVDILSEGERARIVLARAIAPRPAALLVESPTWYVPEVDLVPFRSRLRELLLSLEVPVLIATTDLQDAVGLADHLHVMDGGHLRQSGVLSEVLAEPDTVEVADLVGYVTLARGRVEDGAIVEQGVGEVALPDGPDGVVLSGMARVLAHPAVMLGVPWSSELGCGVSGTIERIRAVGPTHVLDLRVGDRTIEVRWEWDLDPPAPDEVIAIAVTPGTLRFFGDRSQPNHLRRSAAERAVAAEEVAAHLSEDGDVDEAAPASEEIREGQDTDIPPADSTSDEPETDELTPSPQNGLPTHRDDEATRGFTPTDTLMAEPHEDGRESSPVTYNPDDDPHVAHASTSPSTPIERHPSPRTPEDETDTAEAGEPDGESIGVMAPWLQVSKPPGQSDGEDDGEDESRRDPHRGMPLE